MRLIALLIGTLLAGSLLAACSSDPAPVEYPADAVRLRQNIPTPYGDGFQLTAINLTGDRGILVVSPPSGGPQKLPVTKGDVVEVGDQRLAVLDLVAGGGADAPPGAGSGLLVLRPRD